MTGEEFLVRKKRTAKAGRSSVGRVYEELRTSAVRFEFLPGARLNEVAIARQLGVSRTPLREALNRLTVDGFLTFSPNHGFFRKPLEAKGIFDLYELRLLLETAGVKLAVSRGSDAALDEIQHFLEQSGEASPERTVEELVAIDESFHERIMALAANSEMLKALRDVSAKIQYVRVDMLARADAPRKHAEHLALVQLLKRRDAEGCVTLLQQHIEHRLEQIVDAVKKSYGRIYVSAQ